MNNIFENFDKYVKNYDKNNNKIKLKYDHTYRVVGYAKRIAESENLNDLIKEVKSQLTKWNEIS